MLTLLWESTFRGVSARKCASQTYHSDRGALIKMQLINWHLEWIKENKDAPSRGNYYQTQEWIPAHQFQIITHLL